MYFCRKFGLTDTVKLSSGPDKNCSSSTFSRVKKFSFEKKAFKSLKTAYLLSEAFVPEGCNFENKIFLDTRPFALDF